MTVAVRRCRSGRSRYLYHDRGSVAGFVRHGNEASVLQRVRPIHRVRQDRLHRLRLGTTNRGDRLPSAGGRPEQMSVRAPASWDLSLTRGVESTHPCPPTRPPRGAVAVTPNLVWIAQVGDCVQVLYRAEILVLHRAMLEQSGGTPGIRDLGARHAALAQPRRHGDLSQGAWSPPLAATRASAA